MSFRVLQFNMQFGQVWDEQDPDHAPVRLEDTIAEIRSHDADLVLLQEVEHARPGNELVKEARNYPRLQAALRDYHSHFSFPRTDHRELPFGIGLAIFSKTPLRDFARLDIPSPQVEFDYEGQRRTPTDRLLIRATTTLAGRDVHVMNTHLLALFMLNASSEKYTEQRELVASELRRMHGPALLSGDFNVSKHESLVAQFAVAGFSSVQTKETTWRRRPYVLDHIFYNSALRVVSYKVQPTPASDHHVLVAEFEFA